MKTRVKKEFLIIILLMVVAFISIGPAPVSAAETTVCCEKTKADSQHGVLYCQNVPAAECDTNARQAPTACESTSFCKPGVCYNSVEGTCLDNTPQIVCNANNGIWSEQAPPQCDLGCCILGDQAAFVSLVRCKRLSAFFGLQTNYNKNIKGEVECVLNVQNQEKGACIYEREFERTCKFTTRADCGNLGTVSSVTASSTNKSGGIFSIFSANKQNSVGPTPLLKGEFFPGKLCSAEELGTNCAPTRKTACIPGKDEAYFIDSCGNPANIYDASKVDDKRYWSVIFDKTESCNANGANANSKSCGNCNYLQGSICRTADKSNKPTYGDAICADLNCKTTSNGKAYKHGEAWCVYTDKGTTDAGNNAVGSRFYKHICINGEEVLEQCADFRQEECIEDAIETPVGPFSQAACRVNRWQDCTVQADKKDCENTDRRDCLWKQDVTIGNGSVTGACLPKNSPGLKFWEGEEAKNICAQASASCVVVFEKGIFGSEKCKSNCECLTPEWQKQREDVCVALGDCGPKVNWVGSAGYKNGSLVTVGKAK